MNWPKELAAATSEMEVLALVTEYWHALPRWLKCYVPRECHAHPIRESADILAWAFWLSSRFADPAFSAIDIKVQDLVIFFVRASSRIRELRGTTDAACNSQLKPEARRLVSEFEW